MPHEIRSSQQRTIAWSYLFVAIVAAGLGCAPSAFLRAQSPTVHGYVTVIRSPDSFDVNGEHVNTTAETRFGTIGTKNPVTNVPMPGALRIGAWVQVFGERDRRAKIVDAETVLFRDDRDRQLTGLGVIDKVISTAPELVFAADGYRIRVAPEAKISYPKDVKSAADVHADLWVLYEGKLGPDGLLDATKVRYVTDEHSKQKSGKVPADSSKTSEASQPSGSGAPAAKNEAPTPTNPSSQIEANVEDHRTEIQFGDISYRTSKDQALQSRVRRIGMSLVPAYQKHLPDDDSSRIRFDFVAVDDPARKVNTSPDSEGLILVSAQLAARFRNDDQLAAVLADGIEFNLQQEAPLAIQVNRATLTKAAVMGAANLVPFAGLAAGSVYYIEQQRLLQDQRGRMALQLMVDAGYDPWQAPEAWRLAEPGKLPADISTLKYPDRSGYQFAILNLMYEKAAPTNPLEGGSTKSDANPRK